MNLLSLAPLGAGLGQFAQDYRQQQQAALAQMVARMQLQQLQREQQYRQLAGAALSAGGIPGLGGSLGANMQPAAAPAGPAGPTAPILPVSTSPPPPAQPPAPSGPRTLTEEQQSALADSPAQMTPEQTTQLYRAVGAKEAVAGVPLQPEPRAAAPASPTAPDQATAAPAASSPTPPPPGISDLAQGLELFQRLNPTAIARRLKEIQPGASDDAVFGATEQLMKMAQGDRTAQYQAAMIGHLLNYDARIKGIQSTEQRAAGTTSTGEKTVAEKSREDRERAQAATATARANAAAQRNAEFRQRMAQTNQIKDRASRQQALNRIMQGIDAQLGQLRQQGGHDDEIAQLVKQHQEVEAQLRGLAGMSAPAAPK